MPTTNKRSLSRSNRRRPRATIAYRRVDRGSRVSLSTARTSAFATGFASCGKSVLQRRASGVGRRADLTTTRVFAQIPRADYGRLPGDAESLSQSLSTAGPQPAEGGGAAHAVLCNAGHNLQTIHTKLRSFFAFSFFSRSSFLSTRQRPSSNDDTTKRLIQDATCD